MLEYTQDELNSFVAEAIDLLDCAENDLLNSEAGKSAKNNYDSIFRVFHSIKGGAGMFGLTALQNHMHKLEDKWTSFKNETALNKEVVEFFLKGIDVSRQLFGKDSATNFNYDIKSSAIPRLNVAVIDDEQAITDIIRDILEEQGFKVITFNDPLEFVKKINDFDPEVVITDFKMPECSGLDILRTCKIHKPETPVIMISAYLSKDVLIESIRLGGFFTAIEKPFKENDIIKECMAAQKQYALQKLIKRSLNLLLYQFSDLENFLNSQGKSDIARTLGSEIKEIISSQKQLSTRQ